MAANFLFTAIALLCYGALTLGRPTEEVDSYAVIPSKQQPQSQDNFPPNSELNLEMVPPPISNQSSPHIYYMNSDGVAEPAEEIEEVPQRRKRDVATAVKSNQVVPSAVSGEMMNADETIIIGPASGRPFGTPALHLGYRPSQARYARYHKYPWNYH